MATAPIRSPSAANTISDGNGNNTIIACGANETISDGNGSNLIYAAGTTGTNRITDGNGSNVIVGGAGNDTITAGNGSSIIYGGPAATLSCRQRQQRDYGWRRERHNQLGGGSDLRLRFRTISLKITNVANDR
jgi:Ca2+-binding RTX toxin-like protein